MKACRNFRAAETEIHDRIVQVSHTWYRIHEQLSYMKEIESTLTVELRTTQEAILEILVRKLKGAWTKLDALSDKQDAGRASEVKRWKYARTKTSLDECIGMAGKFRPLVVPDHENRSTWQSACR
jgi:hypothetical protein